MIVRYWGDFMTTWGRGVGCKEYILPHINTREKTWYDETSLETVCQATVNEKSFYQNTSKNLVSIFSIVQVADASRAQHTCKSLRLFLCGLTK